MRADQLSGTEPLAAGAGFDAAGLQRWLQARLPDCDGVMQVDRFRGGQSNPTMVLSFDGQRRLVVRKKPDGVLLPSAHAVDREFRVISALSGSDVPVARPRAFCPTEDSPLGTMFYVMDYVEGRSFWEPALPDMAPEARAAIYAEMSRCIAALHSVDWRAAGLEGFGKPENYVARQVSRWTGQYRASETETIAAMEGLIGWLPDHLPAQSRASLIHGDYRIDNMIFDPQAPRILALVDWELSTIGDPMADFAYHMLTWLFPHLPFRGLGDVDLAGSGIPELRVYRDDYLRMTDQDNVSDRDWYSLIAFSLFRVAAIRQGIMKRVVDGTATSAHAATAGALARQVAEMGWHFAEKAMRS